jgi:epsilon-lactone hydrolase
MPSEAMQDAIDALRDRQKASASQAPPTLEERRAAFTPGDRLHPLPDDMQVTEVAAGGVPSHWLTAPGADAKPGPLVPAWRRFRVRVGSQRR